MNWSEQGAFTNFMMVSSASVNLIRVYWSHAVLALDDWIAMTCV